MKYISIQIQPDLDQSANKDEIVSILANAGYPPEVDEGEDNGRYINFHIKAKDLADTWRTVSNQLNKLSYFTRTSIVTCEGNNGWDDYLLLHHYDKNEALDKL